MEDFISGWSAELRNFSPSAQTIEQNKRHRWKERNLVAIQEITRIFNYTTRADYGVVSPRAPQQICLIRNVLSPPKGQRLNSQISRVALKPSNSMKRQKEGIWDHLKSYFTILSSHESPEKSLLFYAAHGRPHCDSLSNSPLQGTLGKQLLWLKFDRHRWHDQLQVI